MTNSSVPAASVSDELRRYPSNRLRSPLDVTRAVAVVEPGTEHGTPPPLGDAAPVHTAGGFEGLVSHDLTVGFVLLSLVLALFWGAAHALEPGHGKAIVAGYLVGTKGRPRDAVALGAIVTASHTVGVFAFGLVTLGLSQYIVPEELYPWLSLAAGLLVVSVGVGVLRSRLHELVHRYLPTTSTTTTTRTSAACSASASPAGSSRARPRSSSCSPRSRSTGSGTGSS